jgi:hypothetical protein
MYRNVDYVTRNMLGKWIESADHIRMHFRGMLRGMVPFSWAWDGPRDKIEPVAKARLDDAAFVYMQRITQIIKQRGKQ